MEIIKRPTYTPEGERNVFGEFSSTLDQRMRELGYQGMPTALLLEQFLLAFNRTSSFSAIGFSFRHMGNVLHPLLNISLREQPDIDVRDSSPTLDSDCDLIDEAHGVFSIATMDHLDSIAEFVSYRGCDTIPAFTEVLSYISNVGEMSVLGIFEKKG